MGCFALVCGRFADSQKSRFQASKRSNMGSAVLEGGPSADIHDFYFQLQNVLKWTVSMCTGVFSDCLDWQFQISNVQIIAVPSFKRVDLLMFTNSGFRVQNVEICAVLSSNEVDLLMLWKSVLCSETIRNVQCSQEWHLQAAKHSDNSRTILQEG